MDKKSVDMEKNSNRTELLGKVEIKESSKKKVNKETVKVDLDQTIALDDVLKVTNPKKHTEEEKRSEITGKFNSKKKKVINNEKGVIENNKRIIQKLETEINELEKENNLKGVEVLEEEKVEEIKEVKSEEVKDEEESMEEDSEDKVQENVENVSVAMIIMILLVCFVVGSVLGYLLYRVAINNSNILSIVFNSLV